MASKQKAPRPKVTRSATCNCGDVEVSVTGVDRSAVLCHCDNCRRSSGSAFMHNHRFVESEMEIKKGKENVKRFEDKNTKSGNALLRHFCSNCGSPLYLQNPKAFPGLVVLHEGSIEGERSQATLEIFPENKYSWADKLIKERAKM